MSERLHNIANEEDPTRPKSQPYHDKFPGKMILSSETAAAFSSRGVYLFPVFDGPGAPAKDGQGMDSTTHQVSGYELYTDRFGASADRVFAAQDQHQIGRAHV